ncbi:MAG: hypothetical protein J6K26_09375 [Lachnospiraceae bacterium]|nr:hypothetical protein [Lachnospiraceae bacterium]
MSLVMDTIKILPKFEGSSSTTAEEMRTYVKAFADKLCSLLGLTIMEDLTQEHTYGVRYFLGETGGVYPLICVGNSESSSYFYRYVFIGITNSNKSSYSTSYSKSGQSNNSYVFDVITYSSYTMKYYKNETMFLFGFDNSGNEVSGFNFLLTKASTENGEKPVFVNIYSGTLYFSYIPEFGQTTSSSALIYSFNIDYVVPYDKECIMNVPGISSVKFPSIYCFSNRINVKAGIIIAKGTEKYLLASYSSSNMSLAIKIA